MYLLTLRLCDVPGERLSWNGSPQSSIFGHLRTVLHAAVGPLLNVCPCSSRSASASFAIHFPLYYLLYDGVVSLDVAKKGHFSVIILFINFLSVSNKARISSLVFLCL